MKPIFFGRSAAASPLVDMRSLLPLPLLLVPPTPTGRPSSRRRSRPRHRGDGAALAACDDENDDENDDDDDDDDDASREGSRGAVAMDEKPDDVRQPASNRTTQVVATIGYLMIYTFVYDGANLMFSIYARNMKVDWSAEKKKIVFLKEWKGGRWLLFDVFSFWILILCGVEFGQD
jgi:hypothetical protein